MGSLHVLYLVPHVPNPTKIRSYMQIKGLAESGQQVTVGTLIRSPRDQAHADKLKAGGIHVVSAPLKRWQMAYNGLMTLPGGRPLQARLMWSAELLKRLEDYLQSHPPDIIHVEHLRMAAYGLYLKERYPVIWDAVDNLASLFGQAASASTSRLWRAAARIEAPRLQSYERWLTEQFPTTLVISRRDQALFQQQNPAADRVRYAPLGVPVENFLSPQSRANSTLIITGTMNYHPNIASVLYFAEKIFPKIRQQRPDVRLEIVGAHPSSRIQALGTDSQIAVTGFVPSVTERLRQATIALAPVTYGAGIQIKVLEAFLTSTPLVATSMAVRGLDVQADEHLLIADTPSDFATAVVRLLEDGELRDRLARAGRHYLEQHHNLTHTTDHLLSIYRSVLV